jgi:hypothetical protein
MTLLTWPGVGRHHDPKMAGTETGSRNNSVPERPGDASSVATLSALAFYFRRIQNAFAVTDIEHVSTVLNQLQNTSVLTRTYTCS